MRKSNSSFLKHTGVAGRAVIVRRSVRAETYQPTGAEVLNALKPYYDIIDVPTAATLG